MEYLVKLVPPDWETHNQQKWELGKTVAIHLANRRPILCSSGVLHAYLSVEQALLMNPTHAVIENPIILQCEAPHIAVDDGTKVGVYELTPTNVIPLPAWDRQPVLKKIQVQFAVFCAREVLPLYETKYPSDSRPRQAIEAAETWLRTGAAPAAAAYAAAYAAYASAYAAAAAYAAYAAYAAAYAAYAAYAAAAASAAASGKLDINALAKKAVGAYATLSST